jgi:choline dehydrogenase-like flavoprotein
MIYIIGSGLSAAASAAALVRRGYRPTILDSGITPDPSVLDLKERLASVEPENWKQEDLSLLKNIGPVATNGIPRKLYFGSDFAFGEIVPAPALENSRASMHRSFALGGFSNVWGAVIQELPSRELQDWPVTHEEWVPHYSAIRELMNLDDHMPYLRSSSQTDALYSDFCSHQQELKRAGIVFERSQLAVLQSGQDERIGCRYCGLCLYGCPYDSRYESAATIQRFIRQGRVNYIPGVFVEKVVPENGYVRIETRSVADGTSSCFQGRRILIAAGLPESSRIILTSLHLYDIPFPIMSSDIFTLPFMRYRASPGIANERLHTLCQLVVRIEDDSICAHPVHLQFYGYNDLYYRLMAQKLGFFAHSFARTLRAVASRLFVIFGYLHSSVSATITMTLRCNGTPKLQVEGQPNRQALRISHAVAQKLFQKRKYFQAIPLPFQLRLDLPGGGYHCGGIFPMRREPGALETDRMGSLASLPGVHIMDASVLPSIPASPIAFTTMANAHRIASEIEVTGDE